MIDRFPQQLAGLAALAVAIVTAAFLIAHGIVNDTSLLEKDVTAVVRVTFAIR
jgi:hypothetical protein